MKILSYYSDINVKTILLLSTIAVSVLLSDFALKLLTYNSRPVNFDYDKIKFKRILSYLIKIWILLNIITAIFQKGFPLFWLITGQSKNYADFGFPTLQGFLNSIYYFYTISEYYLAFKEKENKNKFKLIILLAYPILIMSRAMLVVTLIEILGLYLLLFKVKISIIFKIVVLIFIFILAFGFLGDLRLNIRGNDFLYNSINEKYLPIFKALPSGFIWVYWYFTASMENIVSNIDNLEPLYAPYYSIKSLFPTVVRNIIFKKYAYEDSYSLKMKNTIINTFTIFANYLKDYGMGITIIIFAIYLFFACYIYYKAKMNNIIYILIYPSIFMSIVLSVFTDYFTILPILFQILLSFYIGKSVKIIKQKKGG